MAEAGDPSSRSSELVPRLALALTLAPLVVSAIYLLVVVGGDYHPMGDLAGTELRTRDVGRYMLWTGPYSRDGWFHPGPAVYYVLAPTYRLLGSSSVALLVGALVVNGASIVGMAVIARRRGGLPLLLSTLVACSLLLRAVDADVVRFAWNPYITVLPYGLLVFLCWSMACGDRWALPVATVITTFVAQTHVGYLALAIPLLLAGAGWLVGSALLSRRSLRELLVPGLIAAGASAVLWLPPMFQQLNHQPPNLSRIVTYMQEGEPRTLAHGWKVIAAQYTWKPEWIAGQSELTFLAEPTYLVEGPGLPLLLVPVLLGGLFLWWRGDRSARSLIAVWVLASVVGTVATARTIGLIFAYRLGWAWFLGMTGGLLVIWAGYTAVLRRDRPRETRLLQPAALLVIAVTSLFSSMAAVRAGVPEEEVSGLVGQIAPGLRDALPDGDGAVLVSPASYVSMAYHGGLLVDLEKHGVMARVREHDKTLGWHRSYTGGPVRARLLVAGDLDVVRHLNDDDLELLVYAGSLPQERLEAAAAELEDLEAELDAGEISREEFDEGVSRLLPPLQAAAVFLQS